MISVFHTNIDLHQSRRESDRVRYGHDMVGNEIVTLDVREEIARGREPFGRIMSAVGKLTSGQSLKLIAPFQPVPLFGVLAAEGFSHTTRETTSGDWEVLFSRTRETKLTSASSRACSQSPRLSPPCDCESTKVVDLDTRELEPPQPLVTILEGISDLPPGAELRARTSRRPMHLYPALEERGFQGHSEEQPDGSFVTLIRRA
jgi:uncharacterized protein (DUF2249 family)